MKDFPQCRLRPGIAPPSPEGAQLAIRRGGTVGVVRSEVSTLGFKELKLAA
jgi:hypothetical protein